MIRDVELKQSDSDKIKNQIEFGLIPLSKWNEFFVYPMRFSNIVI